MALIQERIDKLAQLKNVITGMFCVMRAEWQAAYNLIWCSGDVTPQEWMKMLGSDAAGLFALSNATGEAINQAVALLGEPETRGVDNRLPDGWSYVVHQDGTVDLTEV